MTVSTCEQISGELVAFLDGELGEGERRPIADHVSTCLVCRRELDRLTTVQRLLADVSRTEPSPGFAAQFWGRMETESLPPRSGLRPRRAQPWTFWALPALAAAAVLAVAFQFMTSTTPTPRPERVVQAPPRQLEKGATTKVVAEAETLQVTKIDDMRPEDLPPELLEHPELFLRLPVVRRLERLEHFDAVRQEHGAEGGAG